MESELATHYKNRVSPLKFFDATTACLARIRRAARDVLTKSGTVLDSLSICQTLAFPQEGSGILQYHPLDYP